MSETSEFTEWLRERCGDFATIPDAAEALLAEALATRPRELKKWLMDDAYNAIAIKIREFGVNDRARTRRTSVFAEALAEYETGDLDALACYTERFWEARYIVTDGGALKSLGDMVGKDHAFVSRAYGDMARQDAILESVHAVLARKVGKRRTSDVFTPQEYAATVERLCARKGEAT
jgi:hypothetical protein